MLYFPFIVFFLIYQWSQTTPRLNWKPAAVVPFTKTCPVDSDRILIFGGTSMLGKYIVTSFKEDKQLCIIGYGRSPCKNCHVDIKGDIRDIHLVKRVLAHYKPITIITSVKPPLLHTHYRVYLEINMFAMIELIKLAKQYHVQNFIYVSSIAAAGHYHPHTITNETEPQPYYTEYEAPYDVSKRIAEDFLLSQHETGVFNTISLRTSGIIGGSNDPYENMRLPFLVAFDPPTPTIDCNYAGNIADALYTMYTQMLVRPVVGGNFYYFTGEHMNEEEKMKILAAATGKPVITVPLWLLKNSVEWLYLIKSDMHQYNYIDLARMGLVHQTFDQSLFHETFPTFKKQYSLEEAIVLLYNT